MKDGVQGDILDTAFDGYVAVNEEGRVVSFNHQASLLFGFTHDEVLGSLIVDLVVPPIFKNSFLEAFHKILIESRQNGYHNRFETTLCHKRTNEFPVEVSVWTTQTEDGILFNAFVHDISERKKLEKLKDEFIGTVSHELRTPLTIVKGALTNLRDGLVGSLTMDQSRVVGIGSRNVDRLGRIINNLLDLSRLESGRFKVKHKRLTPAFLLQEIIDSFKIEDNKKSLSLELPLGCELPDILADGELLAQLFDHLLSNALYHAKTKVVMKAENITLDDLPDAVKSELLFEKTKGQLLKISIIDDGVGIPSDQMESLFQKFVQINRPTGGAGYKGTGLGLTISKEITCLHQGAIWADSQVGEGSAFHVVLPIFDEAVFFSKVFKRAAKVALDKGNTLAYLPVFLSGLSDLKRSLPEKDYALLMDRLGDAIQQDVLRSEDILFRHSNGNWFSVLAQTTKNGAMALSQRITHVLDELLSRLPLAELIPEVSIGLALYPEDEMDLDKLIASARQHIVCAPKRRVLLVDNKGTTAQMLMLYLQSHGFLVDLALSGERALEKKQSFKPDLMVLDMDLPDMEVWDLSRMLKNHDATNVTPVVVLTSSNQPDIKVKAGQAGVDKLFYKPCDEKGLVDALLELLNAGKAVDKNLVAHL